MRYVALTGALLGALALPSPGGARAAEVAITMDDPEVAPGPRLSPLERNQKILAALAAKRLEAALFVCGMRVDGDLGREVLKAWDEAGHLIANHSYSHIYFPSAKKTLTEYVADFERGETVIARYAGFRRLFRFPFLKEGDTAAKRDRMRKALDAHGYGTGHVTIDASDWYVDQRLRERLKREPDADLAPYRDFYLRHIWDRARYYDSLARKVLGREVKHTLLIHHNLLNALFLKDLLAMLEAKGWRLVGAAEAFADPVFKARPDVLPAGESIIWSLAKAAGKHDDVLRYPGEDSVYEKAEMDRLGL